MARLTTSASSWPARHAQQHLTHRSWYRYSRRQNSLPVSTFVRWVSNYLRPRRLVTMPSQTHAASAFRDAERLKLSLPACLQKRTRAANAVPGHSSDRMVRDSSRGQVSSRCRGEWRVISSESDTIPENCVLMSPQQCIVHHTIIAV